MQETHNSLDQYELNIVRCWFETLSDLANYHPDLELDTSEVEEAVYLKIINLLDAQCTVAAENLIDERANEDRIK